MGSNDRKRREDQVHQAMGLGMGFQKLKKAHKVLSVFPKGRGLGRVQMYRRQRQLLSEISVDVPLPPNRSPPSPPSPPLDSPPLHPRAGTVKFKAKMQHSKTFVFFCVVSVWG